MLLCIMFSRLAEASCSNLTPDPAAKMSPQAAAQSAMLALSLSGRPPIASSGIATTPEKYLRPPGLLRRSASLWRRDGYPDI